MKIYDLTSLGLNKGRDSLLINENTIFNNLGFLNFDLQKGIYIEDWDRRNKFYYEQMGYKACLNLGALPADIINQELKDILEKELKINEDFEQVQFLPIPIVDYSLEKKVEDMTVEEMKKEGIELIEGYYVMNILNIFDKEVINYENCVIIGGDSIFKYAVNKDKIPKNYDIFRIDTENQAYFVSERFWKELHRLDKRDLKIYLEKNKDNLRRPKKKNQVKTIDATEVPVV